jgi:pimeloyl-ACP methyl ester carboxylesterase
MIEALLILFILLFGISIYIFAFGPKLPLETQATIEAVMNRDLPELIQGSSGFASSEGLDIWYESIPPQGATKGTVLLIMGSGGVALYWPPKFIREFVDSGYRVVRYDHRGAGMSTWINNWDRKNPSSLADMAGDAVAVLDALELRQTHILGLSMGGMIAQEIAFQYPGRVRSLMLLMSSGYIGDPDLPGLTTGYFIKSLLKGFPLLKYRILGGERNLIKERIAKQISVMGYHELDIREMAETVLYDLRKRRGINFRGVLQHQTAVSNSGSRYGKLRSLSVPTLVIHGTADRLIPIEHGKKLVEVIPNAKGLWLEEVGHVFPVPDMRELMNNILSHLEAV